MKMYSRARSLMLGVLSVLVVACGGPMVKVSLSSNANLNPGQDQKPLPVVVRVYQLSGKDTFENSKFEDIWKDDLRVLGDSLLTSKEVVINPSDQMSVEIDKHDQARYVGVVAIFRNPVDKKWRDVHELSNGFVTSRFSSSFKVSLVGNTIYIQD